MRDQGAAESRVSDALEAIATLGRRQLWGQGRKQNETDVRSPGDKGEPF
jgi:hypothetical protein